MARDLVKEFGIKKTMVVVTTALLAAGADKKLGNDWQTIINAMQPAEGSVSTGPREVTILKDIEGVQLGRKCSVTLLWFGNESFAKGTTCVKLADAAKGKLYNESKTKEKVAMELLDEARDLTDIKAKVAKFEEYDQKLLAAKAHRAQKVEITADMQKGGVATIDALAKQLKVEVNPVKVAETAETE